MQRRKPPLPALTVKLSKYNVDDVALGVCKTGAEEAGVTEVRTSLSEKKFELWREIKFLPLRRYNLTLYLLPRSHDSIPIGCQSAEHGLIAVIQAGPPQERAR